MALVKHKNGDTEQFGYVFSSGKAVEVADPVHIAKFRGNAAFEVEGGDVGAGDAQASGDARDANGDTTEMATMRKQFDRAFAAMTAERDDAVTERDKALAELAELKKHAATGLKAEHHGGGKFNITNGETVLAKGLSKADADAFNAMTPAEQAEYVKTNS